MSTDVGRVPNGELPRESVTTVKVNQQYLLDELDAEVLDEETNSTEDFLCPECGSDKWQDGPLYNRIPTPGDRWSKVLSTCICLRCLAEIPCHLAERWGGLSEAEARKRWTPYRSSGPNKGKHFSSNHTRKARTLPALEDEYADRPYLKCQVEDLETLFDGHRRNLPLLRMLRTELSNRKSARARHLLNQVRVAIDNQNEDQGATGDLLS